MALKREHYDARYFDGRNQDYQHTAGYGLYIDRNFQNTAQWWVDNCKLKGKSVLEVGCAKGFLVGHLRDLGVEAYGMDWSEYALSCAHASVKEFLLLGDATQGISGKYDWIISTGFLVCVDPRKMKKMIEGFNKAAKKQAHQINLSPNEKFYVKKPLEWWAKKGWKKGTTLIGDSWNNRITV